MDDGGGVRSGFVDGSTFLVGSDGVASAGETSDGANAFVANAFVGIVERAVGLFCRLVVVLGVRGSVHAFMMLSVFGHLHDCKVCRVGFFLRLVV